MKATELMIGDWVTGKKWRENPFKLTRLNDNGKYYYGITSDGIQVGPFLIEEIEPIPLTTEILEKNGFIKDADEDDRLVDLCHLLVPTGSERNSFTIQVRLYKKPICGVSTLVKCWGWLPPYNGGMNDIHLCSANYVHDLQHVLRLCGIDKTIEL